MDEKSVKAIFKPRSKFAHKGNFGHALLIAGSYGKMGAAVLSAQACMRSGVGLLTAHIPRYGVVITQTSVPEAITSIDSNEKCFSEIPDLNKYNAVGIGPGIGVDRFTSDAFILLLTQAQIPLVLDADALNMLDSHEKISLIPKGSILTPHVKEFDRLAGISPLSTSYQRLQAAMEFAVQTGTYLILKGAYTAICTPDRYCYFNTTGNPGMATAGSGDVLTGIILALLAQGYSSLDAAVFGVYLHGLSGDIAVERSSQESMIATDIVSNLSSAFRKMQI